MRLRKILVLAILVGFIESAWTGLGRAGPVNTWMGILSILGIFIVITFPRLWLIPALAMLEEGVHLLMTELVMAPSGLGWEFILHRTILSHWSHAYVGFPLMPWITFPLLTLIGFLAWNGIERRDGQEIARGNVE